jgi:putative transcriptional regulator
MRAGERFNFIFMKSSVVRYLLLVLAPALALVLAASMARGTQKPAETYFLVAQPDLPDPMFRDSVVLMLPPTGTELVVGLIVNKPTKMKLSDLFPDTPTLKKRADAAYFGGPVDIGTPLVVSHSTHPPDGATTLFKDIYLSVEPRAILTLFKDSADPKNVRLYLGRAQWTEEQLHSEMLENSWYNVPSDPDYVFSADPKTVWRTLVARAQAIKTSAPRLSSPDAPMLLPIAWPAPGFEGLDERPSDR